MNGQLEDQTAGLLDSVGEIILGVQDGLGEMNTSELVQLREWITDMRGLLKRLDYAIAVALPVADLQDQIAVAEAADRLVQERNRVAKAKGPNNGQR